MHDNGYMHSDELWDSRQASIYLGVVNRRATSTLSDLGVQPVDIAEEVRERIRRGLDIGPLVTPVRGRMRNWYRADEVRKAHTERPGSGRRNQVIRLDDRRYDPAEILAAFPGTRQIRGGRNRRIKIDELGPVYLCTATGPHCGMICMPGALAEQADSIAAAVAARVDNIRTSHRERKDHESRCH